MAVKWPKAEGRRAVLHEREKYKQSNEKTEKNNILGSDESGGRNMPESVIQANILLSTH